MLQTADSTLSSVVTQLTTAISAGTEGANGTTNASNQQAIADQVQGVLNTVVSEANVSFHGVYLFSGTETTTPPFDTDSTSPTYLQYQGNDGVNSVDVGDGLSVQTNVPGDKLFSDVFSSLQSLVTQLQSGNSSGIQNATTAVSTAMNELSQQRVFYGNTSNMLTSQQTFLNQENVNLQSQENTQVGVDMSQAITQFSQASLVNQAALSATGKVLSETLLNYLPN
jgi:flagellar hook-associated protein 3 FlgL